MILGTWSRRVIRWTVRLGVATLLLALAAAPAVYFGVPKLARTDWARGKVESLLTRAARAPVTAERMEFCWKDGLRLFEVEVQNAPQGCYDVSVRAPEVRIRPRRRARATLLSPEIRLRPRPSPAAPSRSRSFRLDSVELRDASLAIEDASQVDGLRIEKVHAKLSLSVRKGECALAVHRLSGIANGGMIEGSFALRHSARSVAASADLSGSDIAANDFLARLARPAAPVLQDSGRTEGFGRVSFTLKAQAAGAGVDDLLKNARGEGTIAVREAELAFVDRVLREVAGRFALLDGRLLNPSLEVKFSDGETWRLMGWTSADGRLDYAVRPSAGAPFSLTGTLDQPATTLR